MNYLSQTPAPGDPLPTLKNWQHYIDEINHLIASQMEIDLELVHAEAHLFDDLGMDSLDAIDLAMELHKVYKIQPKEEEFQNIRYMRDVYDLVKAYRAHLS